VAPADLDDARIQVIDRLGRLVERAAEAGFALLLENERGVYGETATRCHELLAAINSPALRMAFDPANFVAVGVSPLAEAWPLLKDFIAHVHVKDAVFADGSIRLPGEGDGDILGLLAALDAEDYSGYLTLEPHLSFAGPSSGFSGETGMRLAMHALAGLLARVAKRE
jgi:sugar phosphate isomerase/epimerase